MTLWELIFGKSSRYKTLHANHVKKDMLTRKMALEFLGKPCPAIHIEEGCPVCQSMMRDYWDCRLFKCLNPECEVTIFYDGDFMLEESIKRVKEKLNDSRR